MDTMKAGPRTGYRVLVGKDQYGEYLALESTFTDRIHGKKWSGATGLGFRVVTQGEYDERMSPEEYAGYLRESGLELSDLYTSWFDMATYLLAVEGESAIFDTGGTDAYEDEILERARREFRREHEIDGAYDDPEDWPEYPRLIECGSAGRIFGRFGSRATKFTEVYSIEAIKLIARFEGIADYRELLNA